MDHTLKVLEMFLFSCARLSFDRDTDTFRQAVDLGVTTSSIFYLFFHRSHFWHWPVGKAPFMGTLAVVVHVELLMDHLMVTIMCTMNGKGLCYWMLRFGATRRNRMGTALA